MRPFRMDLLQARGVLLRRIAEGDVAALRDAIGPAVEAMIVTHGAEPATAKRAIAFAAVAALPDSVSPAAFLEAAGLDASGLGAPEPGTWSPAKVLSLRDRRPA